MPYAGQRRPAGKASDRLERRGRINARLFVDLDRQPALIEIDRRDRRRFHFRGLVRLVGESLVLGCGLVFIGHRQERQERAVLSSLGIVAL